VLREKILEIGNVTQVQIDPVSAYLGLGKVDSFRTTDVRAVLGPLVDLASELRVAVIGIMHFNKKTDVTNALLRISDSLAFGATARHCFAVIDDPENKRKLFVRAKGNLARKEIPSLAFNFGVRHVGDDPDTKEPIHAPHILWHFQHIDVTASEAMRSATGGAAASARDDAKKFLTDFLAAGAKPSLEIEESAQANGISRRTLFRAKKELEIAARKEGEVWTWQLPKPQRKLSDDQ
jgi:putative DNA primase/helicase